MRLDKNSIHFQKSAKETISLEVLIEKILLLRVLKLFTTDVVRQDRVRRSLDLSTECSILQISGEQTKQAQINQTIRVLQVGIDIDKGTVLKNQVCNV